MKLGSELSQEVATEVVRGDGRELWRGWVNMRKMKLFT